METTLNLDEYLAIAKRRIWYLVIPFLIVFTLSVSVINSLSPVYRSTATVAVESQQIPEDLVRSTVVAYADELIGFLKQRVMTSARLLGIIDKFHLFPKLRDKTPDSVLIAKLRANIFLETIRDRTIQRRNVSNTVAFELSFEYGDPETAAAVTNELVTMFLQENVKTRTARATETTEFLEREAARLGEQVAKMEARIAAYKQEHSDALPEHLSLRMNMLQSAETSLKDLEREIASLEEEERFLETQRASVGAILSTGVAADRPVMSPAQQLAALKVELTEKTAIYSPMHPDLRSLKRRIAFLEREVAADAGDEDEQSVSASTDPARAQMESRLSAIKPELASLKEQREESKKKIEDLQATIIETPQVERGLKDMSRDYESAMEEYQEISSKRRDAQLAVNLEEEEKAERFELLEPPAVPTVPVWPNKIQLYAITFVLAAGSGAGTAFLSELLDTTIRGPTMLTSILQRPPLVVIPFIESSTDRTRERVRTRWWILAALVIILFGTLTITHFFFRPLDVLLSPLFQVLGFR